MEGGRRWLSSRGHDGIGQEGPSREGPIYVRSHGPADARYARYTVGTGAPVLHRVPQGRYDGQGRVQAGFLYWAEGAVATADAVTVFLNLVCLDLCLSASCLSGPSLGLSLSQGNRGTWSRTRGSEQGSRVTKFYPLRSMGKRPRQGSLSLSLSMPLYCLPAVRPVCLCLSISTSFSVMMHISYIYHILYYIY